MEDRSESILFETEDGEHVPFFVLEQTTVAGRNYLLVSDSEEEEAEAYILEEIVDEEEETTYRMVDDEVQLQALSGVFKELLEDAELQF